MPNRFLPYSMFANFALNLHARHTLKNEKLNLRRIRGTDYFKYPLECFNFHSQKFLSS